MARLYADEQFPREVSDRLRTLAHDVLTVQEAGNANLGSLMKRFWPLPLRTSVQSSPSIATTLSNYTAPILIIAESSSAPTIPIELGWQLGLMPRSRLLTLYPVS